MTQGCYCGKCYGCRMAHDAGEYGAEEYVREQEASGPRYTVRKVHGIGVGAGAFEVLDNEDGSAWGLTIWRDEAESLARKWNAAYARSLQVGPTT